jgi:hypothetical protein
MSTPNRKPARVADYGDESITFADDLARIETHGDHAHLLFALTRDEPGEDDKQERRIVARVIIPSALRVRMARQLASTAERVSPEPGEASSPLH